MICKRNLNTIDYFCILFSIASLLEITLSGNFKEEYSIDVKKEIEKLPLEYRELFAECSMYLEKLTSVSVETNVIKGISVASKVVGKFIGSIPVVKEGQVEEFGRVLDRFFEGKRDEKMLEIVKRRNGIWD